MRIAEAVIINAGTPHFVQVGFAVLQEQLFAGILAQISPMIRTIAEPVEKHVHISVSILHACNFILI